MKKIYTDLNKQNWKLALDDSGCDDWHKHWTLDGTGATISNSDKGMSFQSGLEVGNHNHHGVLWSKQRFIGDMKVSFDFTRLDVINRYVNILYFHANGIGTDPYVHDIHAWSHLRETPYMRTYFDKMDLLHVSFAAFNNDNDDPDDYIRIRRYPVRDDRSFDQMEVPGTLYDTGLFLPRKTYAVTFIKTQDTLAMEILGDGKTLSHCWDISGVNETREGPLGFRQMWQKHSLYKSIKIYTRNDQ